MSSDVYVPNGCWNYSTPEDHPLCLFWLAWQVTGCRAYLEAAKDAEGEDGFRPLTFHSWMVYDET